MAVVEYMLWRIQGGDRREVPEWVGDRGHWMSPIDKSFIGWIDDERDYYVPDTVVTLTKEEFIQRQIAIHAEHPFTTHNGNPSSDPVELTNDEVTAQAGTWYDEFVAKNSNG